MPRNDDYLRAMQDSDLTMKAGNIESRNFFLIHGTADLIVHQQHSLMLARALIEQGVGFRHQVRKNTFNTTISKHLRWLIYTSISIHPDLRR